MLNGVAVSSRGQDTWFSTMEPGFDSRYRYHKSCNAGLMLLHRLQQAERECRVVELHFHPLERPLQVGVTRPFDGVRLQLADQLAQVCDPLKQDAGVSFGCH